MNTLAQFLKETRIQKGLMVREVAQSLNIDQALVSKFESGARKPTRSQLQRLAKILSVDENKLKLLFLSEKILYELIFAHITFITFVSKISLYLFTHNVFYIVFIN